MVDPMSRLRSDTILEEPLRRWVLDTKWQRLDAGDRADSAHR
jgi:5-methylcytosine-specific restriction endonuclease McrBC regulatory subunit McrC